MIKGLFERQIATRTRVGFVFAFVLLLIGNMFSFITTQKVSEQSKSVNHTNLIIQSLDGILSYTTRAESAFRGYLIESHDRHYEVFRRSIHQADSALASVKRLTSANPAQQARVAAIDSIVTEIVNGLTLNFKRFQASDHTTDQIRQETSRISDMKHRLETAVYEMQADEKRLWNARSEDISQYISIIKLLSVISTLIAILLTLYSILVYNRENKAKKAADEQAEIFRKQLENRVSELAEMNSELIELRGLEKFTATGRIARTIAHEVRNPLTNINLAVEQLKTEFEGSENADIFLDMIGRNSIRINKLVSDLLNATKLSELQKKPVSINELLDECLSDAADRIQLNHIAIIKTYQKGICNVSVDAEKIKIAFLNLIVNGIEAMTDGDTLTVATRTEKDKCVVEISDTGRGMSKEQMNRLFEPFFSTKKMGNGLGLANAHNIILSHNGSIKCESEEGKGTTFTITLEFA